MIGVVLLRPGLYALCVEAGAARIVGTSLEPIPCLSGDVDPGGAAAAFIDCMLMSVGILPPGLMIGVPT